MRMQRCQAEWQQHKWLKDPAHQQQDEDPQTMLSGVALVERLMEYCNNQIISNAKLENGGLYD